MNECFTAYDNDQNQLEVFEKIQIKLQAKYVNITQLQLFEM